MRDRRILFRTRGNVFLRYLKGFGAITLRTGAWQLLPARRVIADAVAISFWRCGRLGLRAV